MNCNATAHRSDRLDCNPVGLLRNKPMIAPVTISVSREEVCERDVTQVREIFDSFIPDLVQRNRNRVELEILGYGDDPRELFLVSEVRSWYQELFDNTPDFFLWMNLRPPWLVFYTIMYGTPVRTSIGTTFAKGDLEGFLSWGFRSLKNFCMSHGINPDKSSEHVAAAIRETTAD